MARAGIAADSLLRRFRLFEELAGGSRSHLPNVTAGLRTITAWEGVGARQQLADLEGPLPKVVVK
ncbi:MAG TPA: hypothetical protein VGS58_20670, partial [Candidatus Sulfopaludibacter sp.]|nr:hypothetical protein [Candidatus Sulfopaludibacter sp.]